MNEVCRCKCMSLYLQSSVIYNHFVEPGSDEPTRNMLELLAGLYEEIAPRRRKCYRDTLASIASPDIETWISGTSMDG